MPAPTAPIIVDEHGDLSLFASVRDAELYLEAIDVRNNEYIGYDANGYRLSLSAVGNAVHITLPEIPAQQASVLEQKLRRWLRAIGDPIWQDQECDLFNLVKYCKKFAVV